MFDQMIMLNLLLRYYLVKQDYITSNINFKHLDMLYSFLHGLGC